MAASYRHAIEWIAFNDSAGDTTPEMSWDEVIENIRWMPTTLLVADIFQDGDSLKVAEAVARVRQFKKPRAKKQDSQ